MEIGMKFSSSSKKWSKLAKGYFEKHVKPQPSFLLRNRSKLLLKLDFSIYAGHPTEIRLFRNPFISAKLHKANISPPHMLNVIFFLSIPGDMYVYLLTITLICWSIVDNRHTRSRFVLHCIFISSKASTKCVLNKNTWPEIVNVFLLIAVSTYSVG